jgi:uncharacterized protein HemX
MTQISTTPTAPPAAAPDMFQNFSRGQVLLGILLALLTIGGTVGAPVYHLYQTQDMAQYERQSLKDDSAAAKREINVHRLDIAAIKESVGRFEERQKDIQDRQKDMQETQREIWRAVRDIDHDRKNWK